MGHLNMSSKERTQLKVFDKLKSKGITFSEAAARLGISERWARKKFKRYLELGDQGLVHRNRGRASVKRWREEEKKLTIELLKTDWHGFGPTFTAEKLKERKNIDVSKETVRKAMIEAGLWQPHQKKRTHRSRRARRTMLGMLVQLDGSPHDWFEGRGPKCTLLVFIDDATSKILWLEFVKSESHVDVMRATKNYISKSGVPHEVYVDFGGVFSVNLNNEERDKKTQWERAMEELGIKVNHAYSPQAKGRVERANQTLQDRLVKDMREFKISSIDEANNFLRGDWIDKHNRLFAKMAAESGNGHKPTTFYDLDTIFCIKDTRVLCNDFTIVYEKRIFQIHAQQRTIIRPKDSITVNVRLDGSIDLSIRKTALSFEEILSRKPKELDEKQISQGLPRKPSRNSRRWASGLPPRLSESQNLESRWKLAAPATEAQ